jgi:diacylglycerol kinase (ATP)
MIANVPHYGTGFPLVPEARADDGLLDVLCLPCANRLELLKLFTLAALGTHVATGTAVRGRHVQVTSSRPVPVQIDGDPGGHLPLDVQIRPAAIPLVRLDGKPATDPA